jgi:O-antigen/teichoic acid export membrane protein
VLTKVLGASGFGHLSLFLAITLGVSQLAGSWPFLAVPVLSARGATIAAAFHPAARVAAIGAAVALVVALPVVAVIDSSSPVTLISVCVYALALVGLQGVYSIFQTEGRMASIATTQSLERAVGLAAILCAVAIATVTVPVAEALLAVTAAITCFAAFTVVERRHHVLALPAHERHALTTVMGAVGAMAIASVCAYGVAWVDIYILAAFRSSSEVGVYSLAYQIYNFTIQIGSLWIVATLPRHARSAAEGMSMSSQLQAPRLKIAAGFWGAAVVGGGILVGFLLPPVFGSDFEGASAPLMLLLSSTVLALGYFAATPVLVAAGRTAVIAKLGLVAIAANLMLDLLLVPTIGIEGPAYATIAQAAISTAVAVAIASNWRVSATVMLVGLPAAVGVGLLALGARDPLPLAIAVLAGLTSLSLGYIGKRRLRSTLPAGS